VAVRSGSDSHQTQLPYRDNEGCVTSSPKKVGKTSDIYSAWRADHPLSESAGADSASQAS